MKLLRVDPERPDPAVIAEAAAMIRRGGIVAFPTETVYGLGADALDPAAVTRIFAAKGRPTYNPLIVHCADLAEARSLAVEWPPAADALAKLYWPGPLTLVVRKNPIVPDEVTASLPTVAVRVPNHPVAAALLAASGRPIAAPSANRFTEISPTTAEHVAKGLADRIDLVLDGGPTPVGIESTVVDLSGPHPVLLRPGSFDASRIAAAIGGLSLSTGVYTGTAPRPAPGMTPRHYAPRATVFLLLEDDPARSAAAILRDAKASTGRVAALLRELPTIDGVDRIVAMPRDAGEYARRLYSVLHELDDEGYEVVLVESPPDDPEWAGVADRLARAATR